MMETMGAFDLLKNEGHDRTKLIVQCLMQKYTHGQNKINVDGRDK
jgi:hypothetical protein